MIRASFWEMKKKIFLNKEKCYKIKHFLFIFSFFVCIKVNGCIGVINVYTSCNCENGKKRIVLVSTDTKKTSNLHETYGRKIVHCSFIISFFFFRLLQHILKNENQTESNKIIRALMCFYVVFLLSSVCRVEEQLLLCICLFYVVQVS